MHRRDLLTALALSVASALGVAGCAGPGSDPAPTMSTTPTTNSPDPSLRVQDGPPALPSQAAGPPRLVSRLPATLEHSVALTIDDGVSTPVVESLVDFAAQSGIRLTFFVTSTYASWRSVAPRLRPLVDSGQVQLANHTVTHPDLTKLTAEAIAGELTRCEQFLATTYGVTGRPFYRPPYGRHTPAVDKVAADLGYPTTTMWLGTLEDSGPVTPTDLMRLAQQWLLPRGVVIGHANQPAITTIYPQLIELIRSRALSTVTLDDAFYGSAGRLRGASPK
jgi:peptidoglycan-N-acetylmuramic acid deacetylase